MINQKYSSVQSPITAKAAGGGDSSRNSTYWLRGAQDPFKSRTSRSPGGRLTNKSKQSWSVYSNTAFQFGGGSVANGDGSGQAPEEDFSSLIKLHKVQPFDNYKPILNEIKK